MRYIDADFLIEQLQPAKNSVWNKNDHSKSMSEMIEDFCTELKNAPTADVVPSAEVEKIFADIKKAVKEEALNFCEKFEGAEMPEMREYFRTKQNTAIFLYMKIDHLEKKYTEENKDENQN